jgi:hypothetical protein
MILDDYDRPWDTRVSGQGGAYIVVRAASEDALAAKVGEMMVQGYSPHGTMTSKSHKVQTDCYAYEYARVWTFRQAMVRDSADVRKP